MHSEHRRPTISLAAAAGLLVLLAGCRGAAAPQGDAAPVPTSGSGPGRTPTTTAAPGTATGGSPTVVGGQPSPSAAAGPRPSDPSAGTTAREPGAATGGRATTVAPATTRATPVSEPPRRTTVPAPTTSTVSPGRATTTTRTATTTTTAVGTTTTATTASAAAVTTSSTSTTSTTVDRAADVDRLIDLGCAAAASVGSPIIEPRPELLAALETTTSAALSNGGRGVCSGGGITVNGPVVRVGRGAWELLVLPRAVLTLQTFGLVLDRPEARQLVEQLRPLLVPVTIGPRPIGGVPGPGGPFSPPDRLQPIGPLPPGGAP